MIAVFGANGFIGTALVRRLVSEGYSVKAVSRHFSDAFRAEFSHRAELAEVDFLDRSGVKRALQGVSKVFHLISTSSPGFGNQRLADDIQTNLIPHVLFMQDCVEANIRRMIFLSSGGTVYGRPLSVPITEDQRCTPISSYGLTKFATEKYLQMFGDVEGLDYTILRLSNPFGPGQSFKNGQGLIPAILQNYESNKPITILGDGSAQRDYIYIDDAISGLLASISSNQVSGQILNIGSGEGKSILDVVHALESAVGVEFRKEFLPQRSTDVKANILDISKAKAFLSWQPETDFQEGIRRTVHKVQQ